MKFLSQQIRELIQKAPASSYAIAREAEIDKSAMSRFMNGGRLTMDKLDRLAMVLGVVVTSEVSLIPWPLEKGRPSKLRIEDKKMIAMPYRIRSKQGAKRVANHFASKANTQYFASRRGVLYIEDLDCLVIYNNNPFHYPKIRPKEMRRVVKRLDEIGIAILARGEGGDELKSTNDLYTTTLVLDCGDDRMSEVSEIVDHFASQAISENDASVYQKKSRSS